MQKLSQEINIQRYSSGLSQVLTSLEKQIPKIGLDSIKKVLNVIETLIESISHNIFISNAQEKQRTHEKIDALKKQFKLIQKALFL